MNIPNILSIIRILLIPVVVWRFSVGDVMGAGILFLVAGATDIIDGFIARKFNMITDIGKVLDPLADKGMSLAVLICMCYFAALIPIWAVVIFLAKEFLMMIGGLVLLERNIIIPAVWYGKASTVITSCTVLIILLWNQSLPQGVQFGMILFAVLFAVFAFCMYASLFIQKLGEKK